MLGEEAFRQQFPIMKALHKLGHEIYYNTTWDNIKINELRGCGNQISVEKYMLENKNKFTFFIAFYSHDVLKIKKYINNNANYKIIFRPRGIRAEESFLRNRSRIREIVLNFNEARSIKASDYFCFITNQQKLHFASKYHRDEMIGNKSTVIHNYLPFNDLFIEDKIEKDSLKLVYSGGFSKWQEIDSIFKLIKNIYSKLNNIQFNIFTLPKNNELAKMYINKYEIGTISKIENYNQSELSRKISVNDVGIILRNNSIVNLAASPFKVIDYLDARIGIIMSDNIGDYKQALKDKEYVFFVKNRLDGEFSYDVDEIIQFLFKMRNMNKSLITSDLESSLNLDNEIKDFSEFMNNCHYNILKR